MSSSQPLQQMPQQQSLQQSGELIAQQLQQQPQTPAPAPAATPTPAPAQKQSTQQSTGGSGGGSGSTSYTSMIVGSNYKIGKKIGEGSFGIIYEGVDLLTDTPVAIKFESKKSEAPQLRDEYRTYKHLAGSLGVANVYYYGQEGLHNILVIDLLGSSLEDLFDSCGRKFSIKASAMLAKQMITRVQMLHEKNLIYRDIKPDNFLVGRGSSKQNMVYIVDFGMAKQYRDPKTKQHIPYRERKSLSGTARYMSINTHLGREQSRRDDLEALGHVFFYFLRGSLPWQGLKAATNKQKYEKIGEKKQQTSIKELCDGFPEEFGVYLSYCRKLGFEETPDYDHLRGLMTKVLQKIDAAEDNIYDWMLLDKDKAPRTDQDHLSANQPRQNINPSNMKLAGSHELDMGKHRSNSRALEDRHAANGGQVLTNGRPNQHRHHGDKEVSPRREQGGKSQQPAQQQQSSQQEQQQLNNGTRRPQPASRGFKRWLAKIFCCQ